MKFHYATVSTDGQNVEAQVRWLTRAGMQEGVPRNDSGTKTDRSRLRCALQAVRSRRRADIVTSLDRLLLNPRPRSRHGEAEKASVPWNTAFINHDPADSNQTARKTFRSKTWAARFDGAARP